MPKLYEKYMKKCITLAKKGEGRVSPNPLVGAVILDKNGNIIGQGWHQKYGEAHAEVNAFKDALSKGHDVKNGTIIVNLEPCSHYGKTPPCADLIIKKGIKKVVIGCIDPNPKVDGGGIKKLKEAGIEVITGILEKDCKKLNEVFFKNQLQQCPFIVIKTATTLDGKIATKTGSSKWITSDKSRNLVQRLRNKYDAILTGSGTVISDNPSLTCRMKNGKNPIRIIIDSTLKTPPDAKVYQNDGTRVIIACADNIEPKNYGENVEFIMCPLEKTTSKIDLKYLIIKLYEKGIKSILIEAGGILNGAFIKNNLADKLYHFVAPKITGDNNSMSFVNGFDTTDINKSIKLTITDVKHVIPDIMIEAEIHNI